jgi:hypothetical protein
MPCPEQGELMQKLVLLVVGAVWLAVLVPPLLRSRGDNRPTSSVDLFRRNLSILQKTTPARMHSVQTLARPLAGGRPSADPYAKAALRRPPTDPRLRRTNYDAQRRGAEDHTAPIRRRADEARRPVSRRETQRQRREQIVRVLLFLSAVTAVLALLAKSPMLVYLCAFCVLSLIGYCALLLRIRRDAELYALDAYQRAA